VLRLHRIALNSCNSKLINIVLGIIPTKWYTL
jgi:hypothetical protein